MAATTPFRIAAAAVVVEPDEPPQYAWPTTWSAPMVQHPRPTRANGNGTPGGMIGKPTCEIGREKITADGVAYYGTILNGQPYANVKCKLYDPRTRTWKIYKGILWEPTTGSAMGGYRWREWRARITELVELAGWSSS